MITVHLLNTDQKPFRHGFGELGRDYEPLLQVEARKCSQQSQHRSKHVVMQLFLPFGPQPYTSVSIRNQFDFGMISE